MHRGVNDASPFGTDQFFRVFAAQASRPTQHAIGAWACDMLAGANADGYEARVALRVASIRLSGALALGWLLMGCLPKVGDHCTTSLDCSQTGQRICDVSQPGGYCTVFNCEPDTCPDSSACVAFNNNLDPACAGHDDGEWPRFERTFCVKPCSADSDCRTDQGYVCVTPEERGGIAIDVKTTINGICLADVAVPPVDPNEPIPPVCDPKTPSTVPDPYVPPSTGGSGGVGGAGGSSGGSGGAGASAGAGGVSGSGGTGGV